MVYLEKQVGLALDDGRKVTALTYVADRSHRQYAGRLSEDDVLRHVRGGVGKSGKNPDYVLATHDHLATLGMVDTGLARLAAALRPSSPQ